MPILVLNCGSSSLKLAVIDPEVGARPLTGLAERLGAPEAVLRWRRAAASAEERAPCPGADHAAAMRSVAALLEREGLRTALRGVGHRVVHGGERFTASTVLDRPTIAAIEACVPLAPLHNPANLVGIRLAQELYPDLPQVGVFDTAFHQTLPAHAYLYPVPYALYTEHGVRRYGFHGTSHRYVAERAAALLGRPLADLALITCHLGNGCSLAAVLGGRSVDSTMGLTPLEGVPMGTRSGDVDPGLHAHLARTLGWSVEETTRVLNHESGLFGLSGLSNDMRTLLDAEARGHARARLALEVFCYRVARAAAGLTVGLGRLDALVFTGGIGENAAPVRERVLARLGALGLGCDPARNAAHGRASGGHVGLARGDASGVAALVVPTDEEWMIARDAAALIGEGRA